MSKKALLNVTKSGVEWKGIAPKQVELLEFVELGKAKIVVCRNATKENLLLLMQNAEVSSAIKDAWVLVTGGEFCEEFAKIVHPYVAIANEEQAPLYERFSRGWNVADVNGAQGLRKCLGVSDTMSVEVLFGESRENPIGILSVKCLMD